MKVACRVASQEATQDRKAICIMRGAGAVFRWRQRGIRSMKEGSGLKQD
jgi:hypothetical protein